ncbi:hypothetical protein CEXT_257521 [Caerostris extrusa]|uniref:Uncharacterized protein n=1 Tax=Caerostris extrusa TaxID=172846 RepID=A0AAV4S6I2_CAEEX|nr:hypothetical protein CEXT_257521 [Caerostris extrusa]
MGTSVVHRRAQMRLTDRSHRVVFEAPGLSPPRAVCVSLNCLPPGNEGQAFLKKKRIFTLLLCPTFDSSMIHLRGKRCNCIMGQVL